MYGDLVGSTIYTAGTTIIPPGNAGRIFNIHVVTGGTGGRVQFQTGGSSGVTYIDQTGTLLKGTTFDYGGAGQRLPNGIYMYPDPGVVSVLVAFKKEEPT